MTSKSMFVRPGVTAGAKLTAQETIRNAVRRQSLFQLLAVELRIPPAVWFRANVAKRRDAVLLEQADEALLWVGRVSNGEDSGLHRFRPQDSHGSVDSSFQASR